MYERTFYSCFDGEFPYFVQYRVFPGGEGTDGFVSIFRLVPAY